MRRTFHRTPNHLQLQQNHHDFIPTLEICLEKSETAWEVFWRKTGLKVTITLRTKMWTTSCLSHGWTSCLCWHVILTKLKCRRNSRNTETRTCLRVNNEFILTNEEQKHCFSLDWEATDKNKKQFWKWVNQAFIFTLINWSFKSCIQIQNYSTFFFNSSIF